jgi:TetR/AcrR family transcriptional regulator, transcriptional repressor for nem operon
MHRPTMHRPTMHRPTMHRPLTVKAQQRPVEADTAEMILNAAELLVQTRGYNGCSYADVAFELGITKAALHYHFASKGDLGLALLTRYTDRFMEALNAADTRAGSDVAAKLHTYGRLYLDVLLGGRMCLCGMLAAEYQTLPEPMQTALIQFFDQNERWLTAVLEQGRTDGSLRFDGPPEHVAQIIVSDLEGAMLIARVHHDPKRFTSAFDRLLETLRRPANGNEPTPRPPHNETTAAPGHDRTLSTPSGRRRARP